MKNIRGAPPVIFITVFLPLYISHALANPMNNPSSQAAQVITVMPITIIPPVEPPDWRDFRTLSAHPSGEEVFFVECHKDLPEKCRVLRFNLKTHTMAYYALPTEYAYLEAYLSPSGKKLALVRVSQQVTSIQENLEHREIAIMNIDGSGLEVLPLATGPKTMPKFNASDDRLAFWRSKSRKPGSKTLASGYDVYEYDFMAGKEYPFGASYKFFQGGEIHYLSGGDELLVKADVPLTNEGRLGLKVQDYGERYPNHIFRLKRGNAQWVAPLFANVPFKRLRHLALSSDGELVFSAEAAKEGISIFREDRRGGLYQWQEKTWDAFEAGELRYITLIRNQLLGIFRFNHSTRYESKGTRFLTLDMQSGEWRAMSIPPLFEAKAISVILK